MGHLRKFCKNKNNSLNPIFDQSGVNNNTTTYVNPIKADIRIDNKHINAIIDSVFLVCVMPEFTLKQYFSDLRLSPDNQALYCNGGSSLKIIGKASFTTVYNNQVGDLTIIVVSMGTELILSTDFMDVFNLSIEPWHLREINKFYRIQYTIGVTGVMIKFHQ